MLFNLRTKAARDMVIREFEGTNYGVVNPRTIDNVSRLFPWVSIFVSHSVLALRVAIRTTDRRFHR